MQACPIKPARACLGRWAPGGRGDMREHTQAGAQAGPAEGKPPRQWAGGGGCHSDPGHSPYLRATGQKVGAA